MEQKSPLNLKKKSSLIKYMKKILITSGLFSLLIALFIIIAGMFARSDLKKGNPPPGKLIDMGGYKMHLHCQGNKTPTVVLEAGQGGFSLSWSSIFANLAQHSRVCAYDRAGFGWSDIKKGKMSSRQVAEDLHKLLHKAGERGPYLLVGHSLGGIFIRHFAFLYPEETSGLVLVDPAHEDMIQLAPVMFQKAFHNLIDKQINGLQPVIFMNRIGIIALAPENIPPHPDFPPKAQNVYRSLLAADGRFFTTYINELQNFKSILDMFKKANTKINENVPLYVLTVGKFPRSENLVVNEAIFYKMDSIWLKLHSQLAKMSKRGKLISVAGSSHSIQVDQPAIVEKNIQQAIDEARK